MIDPRAMDRIVAIAERKAAEATRRQRAVAELRCVLDAYARAHGGRFLLFGSAARGQMRYDSDVDILVEFPPDQHAAAWNFAERQPAGTGASGPRRREASAWCRDDFLALVRPKAEVLGG